MICQPTHEQAGEMSGLSARLRCVAACECVAYVEAEDGGQLLKEVLMDALGVAERHPVLVAQLIRITTVPDRGANKEGSESE